MFKNILPLGPILDVHALFRKAQPTRWLPRDTICPLIIVLAGLITQTWFPDDQIIMGGDYVFRITPQEEFRQTFYIWQSGRNGIGSPVFDMAELFPYRTLLVLVDLMGGSLATGQRVVFYYLLTVSGLSAYYLGRTVLPQKGMYVGSLACALFYMFNTYAIFFKWIDRLMSLFTYCMVPLLLALYIEMLETDEDRQKLKYAVLIALVSTTMASTQPAYFLLGVMPLPLFCVYYLLCLARNNSARLKALIASSIAVLLMVIVNIWWIAPLFLTFRETQSEILNYKLSAANFGASLVLNSAETSFLNIVRLVGYWALNSNFKGEPYFVNNAQHYFSTEFTLASFLLAGLVFIPLLASRDSQRKMIVYFAMLAVSSLFLVEGVHPPLGQVFARLYRNVPLFILLESQYEKAGAWLVLAYAVLLGFFFSKLSARFSWRRLRALVLGILFGLLFVYLPSSFWDGTIVPPSRGQFLKSYRVAVPDYYYETASWFRQQADDFRIAVLPPARIRSYSWSAKFDSATFSLLYGKTFFSFDPEASYLASLYGQPSNRGFLNALRLYNVEYIQLEKDFDTDTYDTPTIQSAQTLLKQSPDTHYIKSFGELDIYQIDKFVPHVYAPVAIRNCPACPEAFANEAFSSPQSFPPALFFSRDLPLPQREAVEQSFDVNLDADFTARLFPPQINAEKVDDTHYRVSVKNATKPYLLVFAEAYRPFWKAYIVNPTKPDVLAATLFETWLLEPLPEQFHWTINGYANGWWVNQTGDYEIILEYWSQRAIWPSLFVSALAIVGCFGGLLVSGAPWKRLRGARRFGFEQTS